MRLLASTDIALRILMVLAREPPGHHLSVDTLAGRLGGLSRHHLHKIVQTLTALDVTRTVRGAGGGVMLAAPPDQIRLGSLIERLEEEQAIVECFRSDSCNCTLVPECGLRFLLHDARKQFHARLDQHTLADCLFIPTSRKRPPPARKR